MAEHEESTHNLERKAGSPTVVGEGQFAVGIFSEIGREGARRYSTTVTAAEMELVCRHWANVLVDIAVDDQLGHSSNWNKRARLYARARLLHFAEHLGIDKIRAVLSEVTWARLIEQKAGQETIVETVRRDSQASGQDVPGEAWKDLPLACALGLGEAP